MNVYVLLCFLFVLAPIITSCFWYQHRESCVDKDLCIMRKDQQLCKYVEYVRYIA